MAAGMMFTEEGERVEAGSMVLSGSDKRGDEWMVNLEIARAIDTSHVAAAKVRAWLVERATAPPHWRQ